MNGEKINLTGVQMLTDMKALMMAALAGALLALILGALATAAMLLAPA